MIKMNTSSRQISRIISLISLGLLIGIFLISFVSAAQNSDVCKTGCPGNCGGSDWNIGLPDGVTCTGSVTTAGSGAAMENDLKATLIFGGISGRLEPESPGSLATFNKFCQLYTGDSSAYATYGRVHRYCGGGNNNFWWDGSQWNFKAYTAGKLNVQQVTCATNCKPINVVCKSDSDCNDNNPNSEDKCLNPGTAQSSCQHNPIVCLSDSQCGINAFFGNNFCQNNNIFQNFITYHCNNPGQTNSFCSNSVSPDQKQDCGTSSEGNFGADYCKNNNVYKSRTNHNKGCLSGACFDNAVTEEQLAETCANGCSNGQCSTPVINCSSNSDCGTDIFGDNFCQDNDIFKLLSRKICVNSGTPQSFCITSIVPQLSQDCGENSCDNFGANYCKNNNVYKSRTCNDKGCSNNLCFNNQKTDEQLVQTCCSSQVCSNGQCITIPPTPQINCTSDSQCGTNIFTGNNFCQNNNVFGNFITYTCINPGTANSHCSSSTAAQLKQGCGNSSCSSFGANYCKGKDVYHSQTCYNKGCSTSLTNSTCFNNSVLNETLVKQCSDTCSNGKCTASPDDGDRRARPNQPSEDIRYDKRASDKNNETEINQEQTIKLSTNQENNEENIISTIILTGETSSTQADLLLASKQSSSSFQSFFKSFFSSIWSWIILVIIIILIIALIVFIFRIINPITPDKRRK